MENLKLSIRIDNGKFQIWEELPEGRFFCCEDVLNSSIELPQQLSTIIHKAITDPELANKQLTENCLTDQNGFPKVITISDEKVLFTKGDIETIAYDYTSKRILVTMKSKTVYYFSGVEVVKFLNHFPYSYFEKAKTLAELYLEIVPINA